MKWTYGSTTAQSHTQVSCSQSPGSVCQGTARNRRRSYAGMTFSKRSLEPSVSACETRTCLLPKSFVKNLQETDQGRVVQEGPWAVFLNKAGRCRGAARPSRLALIPRWCMPGTGERSAGTPNFRPRY